MKTPNPLMFLCLLLAGIPGSTVAKEPASAMMRFQNNDQIGGSLKALGDDSLLWESDILAEPATFHLKDVLNLTLHAENRSPETSHVAILTLRNGDVVHGQLDSISDHSISIRTWFAGPIHFNRLMVSQVQIEGGTNLYYRGPSGVEGWDISPADSWQYNRQAFISSKPGSIARDEILPDECIIHFTVQRKGSSLDLKLMLFSQETNQSRPRSGYELSFQRSSIYLRNGRNRNFLGSSHSSDLSNNDKARVEIRTSRKSGKVVVLINDEVVMNEGDPNMDRQEFGSGLHFISGNNDAIRISDIEIGPWDGKLDGLPQPQPRHLQRGLPLDQADKKEVDEDEGRMKLANGDSLDGDVQSIREGMITLDTELGEIRLPVERFRSLNLEGLGTESARRLPGDIRAYFADGSTLVFRLDKVDGNRIVGTSQNFSTKSQYGTVSFDLTAINRIEFDIHKEELKAMRNGMEW